MIKIEHEKIIAFDVDNTLSFQLPNSNTNKKADVVIMWNGEKLPLWKHNKHIEELIKLSQDHFIIVWSQQSIEWIEKILNAFEIASYVHLIQMKPQKCFDDLPFKYWSQREYIGEIED